MRTTVYVDGLNLYHGSVQGTSYKWLDLFKLCENVIGGNINGSRYTIDAVKYFTAPNRDPNSSLRQMTYINAMMHLYPGKFSVTEGYFKPIRKRMRNANPPPRDVVGIGKEEKGTDVNLAVHLVNDAWLDIYDCCVLVSNDGDMAEAMRLVRQHHPDKTIGLINPIKNPSKPTLDNLYQHADFTRRVRMGHLASSQMPSRIQGTNIQKPQSW